MKLLIAVDMEGISGVVNWEQVGSNPYEYQRFRKIMTGDVNAAVEGAYSGGADEIIVADGHSEGFNILLENLHPRARINTGNTAPLAMIQGLANGIDAAMFIGYHGRAGHPLAVLNHTWDMQILNVWLNDMLVGETGINAAVCGHFNIPVLLVTGDQGLAEESSVLIPGIETVIVKKATSRFSAECLSLKDSRERIQSGAEKAVRTFLDGQHPKPLMLTSPVKLMVEFATPSDADRVMKLSGVSRLNGLKVLAEVTDTLAAYKLFQALAKLTSP